MERKKTFLTIHFQENADPTDIRSFSRIWQKRHLTSPDIQNIRDLFDGSGTFHAARQEIALRIDSAVKALDDLESGVARDDLRKLALRIKERVS